MMTTLKPTPQFLIGYPFAEVVEAGGTKMRELELRLEPNLLMEVVTNVLIPTKNSREGKGSSHRKVFHSKIYLFQKSPIEVNLPVSESSCFCKFQETMARC